MGYANPDAVTFIGGLATTTYDNNGNLLTYKASGTATSTFTWDYAIERRLCSALPVFVWTDTEPTTVTW
jgi:hypothetical protein